MGPRQPAWVSTSGSPPGLGWEAHAPPAHVPRQYDRSARVALSGMPVPHLWLSQENPGFVTKELAGLGHVSEAVLISKPFFSSSLNKAFGYPAGKTSQTQREMLM